MLFLFLLSKSLKVVQEKRRRKQLVSGNCLYACKFQFGPSNIHIFFISAKCFSLRNSTGAFTITLCRMLINRTYRNSWLSFVCPWLSYCFGCFSSVLPVVTATVVTASLPTTAIPDPSAPCRLWECWRPSWRPGWRPGTGDVKDGFYMILLVFSEFEYWELPNLLVVRRFERHRSWTSACWSTPSITTTPSSRKPSSQPLQGATRTKYFQVFPSIQHRTAVQNCTKWIEMVPNS